MADNSRKTPLASTLPAFARKTFDTQFELSGYSLPCHVVAVDGAIVTIAFDVQTADAIGQVTIPVLSPEYIRLPIQVGDKGLCIPANAYLGPVSGLGGSASTLLQPANLGALAFIPIGNKNWAAVDGNVLVLYGPDGVTIRDAASNTTLVLTGSAVTITRGSVSMALDDTGVTIDGNLTVTGNTSFGGVGKAVVLDGDPVSGGVVHASSTTIKAT